MATTKATKAKARAKRTTTKAPEKKAGAAGKAGAKTTAKTEVETPTQPRGRNKPKAGDALGPTMEVLAELYLLHLEQIGKSRGTVFSYSIDLAVAVRALGKETRIKTLTPERAGACFESDAVKKTRAGKPKAKPTIDKTRRVLRLALTWAAKTGQIPVAPIPAEVVDGRKVPAKEGDGAADGKGAKDDAPLRLAKGGGRWRAFVGVSLENLIGAGLVRPPLDLRRTYRGVEVRARIEADGTVSFEGTRAPTLSKAADLARTKVLEAQGETATVNTNGWTFWSYVDADGKPRPVDELRRRYLEAGRDGKSAS